MYTPSTDTNATTTHMGRPAGELDELHLVGAPEQGVPVVD